jgi:hypothetical protein
MRRRWRLVKAGRLVERVIRGDPWRDRRDQDPSAGEYDADHGEWLQPR